MSGGALKKDAGKPDLTLVSEELLIAVARVREFGTKKYSRDDWKKGFKITRSLAAVLRHIFRFLSGETNDPESGLCHLHHAVAGLEHCIYDLIHHPENDDRGVTKETVPKRTLDDCPEHPEAAIDVDLDTETNKILSLRCSICQKELK